MAKLEDDVNEQVSSRGYLISGVTSDKSGCASRVLFVSHALPKRLV